jgi:hypothetical protein
MSLSVMAFGASVHPGVENEILLWDSLLSSPRGREWKPLSKTSHKESFYYDEVSQEIFDDFGIHKAGKCTGIYENDFFNLVACHAEEGYFVFDMWFDHACLLSDDGEEAMRILLGIEKPKGWWKNGEFMIQNILPDIAPLRG